MRYADRTVVLRDGEIVFDGSPERLQEGEFCRAFGLRRADIHGHTAPERATAALEPQEIAAAAGQVGFAYPRARAVLRDLSFALRRGAALLVVGPNGAGKTTLLRLFAGLLRPDEGEVSVDGRRPRLLTWGARKTAFVGQEPAYHLLGRSVMDQLRLAENRKDILDRHGLGDLLERHPLSLSEGEKRRLAVASALASKPLLLILDEPSIGMDGARLDLLVSVLHEHTGRGAALLVASNDPDLLESLPASTLSLPAASGSAPM